MKKEKKGMSKLDIFSLGFGSIIGIGWSVTINDLYLNSGSPIGTAIGMSLAVIFFLPVALCYAELCPAMPVSGGIVAYSYKAFSPKVAFAAGWLAVMAYASFLPYEVIAISDLLSLVVPEIKAGTILYTIAGTDVFLRSVVIGLIFSGIIILVNWFGIKKASFFQSSLVILLVVGSVICIIFGIAKADLSNALPLYEQVEGKAHTSFMFGMITMFALAPAYFSGFDTIPQAAEEAGGVESKAIGKIMMQALIVAGVFYLFIFAASALPLRWTEFAAYDRPAFSNLLLNLYPGSLGEILFWTCFVATIAGILTSWNGLYIAATRVTLGMGRAGLLPKVFGKLHPKHNTPYAAILLLGSVTVIGPFLPADLLIVFINLAGTCFVVTWGFTAACAIKLRISMPEMHRPYSMPGGIKMAYLALAICVLLTINSVVPGLPGYLGPITNIAFVAWSIIGVIFYIIRKRESDSLTKEEVEDALFGSMKK